MHRVDTSTAIPTLPSPQPMGAPGFFTPGNPGLGQQATVPGPDFFNMVQEELAGVVLGAGLTLDATKTNFGQLLAAIVALAKSYGFSTGDGKLTFKTVADAGWIMADDGTIGSASSGASNRAHADTQALYTLLWTNINNTYAPVIGGRGASASADFAANKPLTLTRQLGRALAIAGAGSGLTARTLGQYLGQETVALTADQNGQHTHIVSDPGHNHATNRQVWSMGGGKAYVAGPAALPQDSTYENLASATTGISLANSGTGAAHENMPPESFLNFMIKL